MSFQYKAETNTFWLIIGIILTVSIGGLVQIVPLFFQASTTEAVAGLKPYDALRLEGRDIYIREGCNTCHSQMIRPLRAETERYGHYSVAGEFVYDKPFLWGSKRTGPDLHRVGGRYSDSWHIAHLTNPRDVVPESVMPRYAFLAERQIDSDVTERKLRALASVGVPYTEEDFAGAKAAVEGKSDMDAVVAYLQGLGLELDQKR